jgi:hypothetical protein
MTQRQHLRRQPGNDGKVRVLVPRDMLAPSHRASQDPAQGTSQRDRADDAQDAMRTAIEALRGENTALRGQIEAKDALIGELRIAANRADAAAQVAQAEAEKLRQADDVRKARGRWARLRAAWRGE